MGLAGRVERCPKPDVPETTVVACIRTPGVSSGECRNRTWTVRTTVNGPESLRVRPDESGVIRAVMESTGPRRATPVDSTVTGEFDSGVSGHADAPGS